MTTWMNKIGIHIAAILVRAFAFIWCSECFGRRPELVTPLNSYRRLLDGIRLNRDGISPYDGQMFQFPPIMIALFDKPVDNRQLMFTILMILDAITAEVLRKAAKHFIIRNIVTSTGKSRINLDQVNDIAILVMKCYLLNPITICTCAALSISVVHNALIALVAWSLFAGYEICAASVLAIATQMTFYPVLILPALALRGRHGAVLSFLVTFAGFFALNWYLEPTGRFVNATYGFVLAVPDLSPNVGIFWYFFIQIFDHFRRFFLWVFQLNLLVYVVPLTVTLRHHPFLLFQSMLILLSVFSSYPSLSDSCIYLSLLPLFGYMKRYFRHTLVIACAMVVCVVLAPVMWQMWIVFGSGNANFYFAVTMVYCIAQVFLLTDLLYAQLRCQVAELYGEKVDAPDAVGFILQSA